jgi:diacylglycerol kinase family enzyme
MGNVPVFPDASPTDGILEVGIVTAEGRWQWMRTLARTATRKAPDSPFVELARGRKVDVRFSNAIPYELDGGDRKKTKRLRISVKPEAVTICVPPPEPAS